MVNHLGGYLVSCRAQCFQCHRYDSSFIHWKFLVWLISFFRNFIDFVTRYIWVLWWNHGLKYMIKFWNSEFLYLRVVTGAWLEVTISILVWKEYISHSISSYCWIWWYIMHLVSCRISNILMIKNCFDKKKKLTHLSHQPELVEMSKKFYKSEMFSNF